MVFSPQPPQGTGLQEWRHAHDTSGQQSLTPAPKPPRLARYKSPRGIRYGYDPVSHGHSAHSAKRMMTWRCQCSSLCPSLLPVCDSRPTRRCLPTLAREQMGATDTTLPPYARQKPNGGTHANTFGSGPLNRRCCASFFDSAQDVCVYFYWALPDTSCRRNESRGAAGRPGSDWTTGRSGAHAPGMAQGSSSWD
jgi:hypothetical protein